MRLVLVTVLATLLADAQARADLPGDTIDDPLPVLTIPFVTSGTTCSYQDDYDEFCPIDGQVSPDVVYAYAPATDVQVNVSLCESGYDTKILVYENDRYHLHACNDDWCDGPNYDYPYLAYLRELLLTAGNVYYFVVDGYFSSCGPYVLRIDEPEVCTLVCPAGADEEAEIKCVDGSADSANGGCRSDPPVFQTLAPSPEPVAICGFTNAEGGVAQRDEDWYEIIPSMPDTITVRCEGDFGVFLSVFDGGSGCEQPPLLGYRLTEPCELVSLPVGVPAGPVWIRIRPILGWSLSCPAKYVLTIEGYEGGATAISRPEAATLAADLAQLTIAPNPFSQTVRIRGALPSTGGPVTLRIYDAAGRVVRTLHDGASHSGIGEFSWEGRDDAGGRVAGGTYFVRLSAGDVTRTRKVVFLGGKR